MSGEIAPVLPQLLTPDEAGEVMRCSGRTVRRLWQNHEISGIKIGYQGLRFAPEDIAEFLEKRRVPARD
jgi:excisionase family DNA binding protein